MPSVGFSHLAAHITRKDWAETRKVILLLTAGLLIPALLVRVAPERSEDFAKGLLAGLLVGAGFGYSQFCFLNERQRGTLELLMNLPVHPWRLILAKYVSMYSMVLFTVNLPALIAPDLRLVYVVNAATLFLSTVFMSASVISDKPWASQAPVWILLVLVLPIQRLLSRYYPAGMELFNAVVGRPVLVASAALLLVPLLVWASVSLFAAKVRD